jgi:hypothetical protein
MKKQYFTFLAALFIAVSVFGQAPGKTSILAGNNQKMGPVPSAPEQISYQAVVRDATNAIVANKLVGMRISIVQSGSNSAKNQRPSAVYEETQTPTTNANGLLSVSIGAGTGSDDFSAIDWSVQPHYITIEIDPTGNNGNYTITGTTQLASVPYALYAKTSSDAGAVAANTAKVGYTEALVSANTDVAANKLKVGYTEAAVSANTDVAANTAKVGYTEALVSANTDVAANTAKVGYTEALVSANTDVAANTAKVGYSEALVSANTDVAANTAKVGYTEALVSANTDVAANTAKVGYTEALVSDNEDVVLNKSKVGQAAGTTTGDMQYWNGTAWVVVAATPNEGATLQMIAGIPTWVGGTPPPPPPAVGDFRDGGIVFWVDPENNAHGLVCAIEDQSSGIRWYNGNYTTTGATGSAIGTGSANTTAIIANQGAVETAYAAGLARAYSGGGYTDWFLPSKDELNQMYENKATLEAVSGFFSFSDYYWSSTEYNNDYAWLQVFSNGFQTIDFKYFTSSVRAVRAF